MPEFKQIGLFPNPQIEQNVIEKVIELLGRHNMEPVIIDESISSGSQLDLVITSDTAIAHLAGALGCPTWVALCHSPDWRWQQTGSRCAWYPTMRLFRQPRPGDWHRCFTEIASALTRLRDQASQPHTSHTESTP